MRGAVTSAPTPTTTKPAPTSGAPEEPASRDRSRRRPWIWGAILAGALFVRLPAVFSALPYVYHPDEPLNYRIFHGMVAQHRANPRFFNYPSLFFEIEAAGHGIYVALGKLLGWFPSANAVTTPSMQTAGSGVMRDYGPFVAARLVTVVTGVGIVAVAMLLAWLCTRRRGVVVFAGLACALHPLLITNSGWITPDTLAGLTATAAVAAAVVVARHPRPRAYLVAGALTGLAASAKYNAVLVGSALLVAHFMFARKRAHAWRNLGLAACATVVAFFVTTPYALFDPHTFWHDFTFELRHYGTGHTGDDGGAAQMNISWLWGSTGPLLLCALGCAFARANVRRLLLIPATFVVVYLVAISVPRVRFERNLVPMLPALLVLAAVGVWTIGERLAPAFAPNRRRWVALGIVVAVLAWPAALTAHDLRDAFTDGRASARDWITHNIAPGSAIAIDGYAPYVDPGAFRVEDLGAVLMKRSRLDATRPDAVVVTTTGSGRYLHGGSAKTSARATLAWLRSSACADRRFGSDKGSIEVLVLHCAAATR